MFDIKDDWKKVERAVIVGTFEQNQKRELAEEHLDELEQLVENIEVEVVGRVVVKLRGRNVRYFTGSGKAQEICEYCQEIGADCIVFDDSMSPSQQRNWEALTNLCVVDRQEIILDIFSSRAQTKEACLQIELAKALYSLPRLKRAWTHLSRQRGGNKGTRGEGEQQLEVDRRLVSHRIKKLERELEQVKKHRDVQRKQRQKKPVPNAAIVGYTNAGKSTLLNTLTGSDVLVADNLFATLDPTTKPIELENNQTLLLTDTVGFIRKLPHLLVESFKATLEEAVIAEFLIHVVDASSEHCFDHYETTLDVLSEIGVEAKSMIPVFNKVDLVEERHKLLFVKQRYPDAIFVSTYTGEGLDELKRVMSERLNDRLSFVRLNIPLDRFDIVALLQRTCNILSEDYEEDYVEVTANIIPNIYKDVAEFIVK